MCTPPLWHKRICSMSRLGLRRRRDRRAVQHPKGCRRNISTMLPDPDCSSGSRAAGILSDPHRARHPEQPRPRSPPSFRGCGAGRVRRRRHHQGPPAAGALKSGAYIPVDISGGYLKEQGNDLKRDYPNLGVYPVVADFTAPIELPPVPTLPRVGFFPGSRSEISSPRRRAPAAPHPRDPGRARRW